MCALHDATRAHMRMQIGLKSGGQLAHSSDAEVEGSLEVEEDWLGPLLETVRSYDGGGW